MMNLLEWWLIGFSGLVLGIPYFIYVVCLASEHSELYGDYEFADLMRLFLKAANSTKTHIQKHLNPLTVVCMLLLSFAGPAIPVFIAAASLIADLMFLIFLIHNLFTMVSWINKSFWDKN